MMKPVTAKRFSVFINPDETRTTRSKEMQAAGFIQGLNVEQCPNEDRDGRTRRLEHAAEDKSAPSL